MLAPLAGLLLLVFSGVYGVAQEEQNRQLDATKATLDAIEVELAKPDLDDGALGELVTRINEARSGIGDVQGSLTPQQQAINTRISQLGEKPAEGAPPESPEITQERDAQLATRQPIDEALKRAGLLLVQSDQALERATAKRRDLFASRVLNRSYSLLSPQLWTAVASEAPRRWAASQALLNQFANQFTGKLSPQTGAILAGAILLAIVIAWPLRVAVQRLARRYVFAQDTGPGVKRSAVALLLVIIITAAPLAAAFIVFQGLVGPGLVPNRLIPFMTRLVILTGVLGLIAGLTHAVLAPGRPSWRLTDLSNAAAERLRPYPLWIGTIYVLTRAVRAFLDSTGVGLAPTVAIDGISALLVAAAFAAALRPSLYAAETADAPRPEQDAGWGRGVVRVVAWILIGAVLVCLVAGYVSLAFFLAQQMIWLSIIGAMFYMLNQLVDGLCAGSASAIGRFAQGTIGLRDQSFDQLCAIFSGVMRLLLITLALFMAAAPWGVQSGDAVGWFRRALSGFQLGSLSVSPAAILGALVFLIGGVLLTRGVQRWLEKSYLPHTRLDEGLKNSIRTATGYAGVLAAVAVAVSSVGFGLEKLAIVAGALSVGIGFGLQSVVSNFVSGLILLAERPVKVGDWVSIGSQEGNVRRISVRSTLIEQFDRSTVIVPNSDLITKPVLNRTHQNPLGRVQLNLGTGFAAGVQEVRSILLEVVTSHRAVLSSPAPIIQIVSTTDSGVQWQVFCYVASPRQVASTKGDLYLDILTQLQAKGLNITASP
ncbi:DUF3772 domain-containing protein [Terrihabitans rhizophilus]|uniref:DUF3772 domain-containing protein n=1 Tax=Terrihabitans rhizophilus TaxID=3092662 RepID=A0ABU4RNS2_9HYPH|nr:DUF3772 domain-containing protein [Terrihabitans sp. PJ23]MDX6806496.1 DUF3772 domain-containing protein [Terrihabitans sp. PJ23]